MALHAVRLPVDIEQGAQGGLGFYTSIIASPAGSEQRNQNWEFERGEWDIAYGMRRHAHLVAVYNFQLARRGRAHAFLFKDWSDYDTEGFTFFGTGDGVTRQFQLYKTYPDDVNPYLRPIYAPREDTMTVNVAGVATAFTLLSDGIVEFSELNTPAVDAELTWDGEFDIPVRFKSDRLVRNLSGRPDVYQFPNISIVGVCPPDY